MGKNRAAQPGRVKARVKKMFDGRNMATRPIPVIHDTSDDRAIAAAVYDTKPRGDLVNMPSGRRVSAKPILGTQIGSKAKLRAGVYNPPGVEDNR